MVDVVVPPSGREGLQMIVVNGAPPMLSTDVLVTARGTDWVWTTTCVHILWIWCVIGTISLELKMSIQGMFKFYERGEPTTTLNR